MAVANGKSTPQACKEAGIHTQTYYRWRKEYGGLKAAAVQSDQAARRAEEQEGPYENFMPLAVQSISDSEVPDGERPAAE